MIKQLTCWWRAKQTATYAVDKTFYTCKYAINNQSVIVILMDGKSLVWINNINYTCKSYVIKNKCSTNENMYLTKIITPLLLCNINKIQTSFKNPYSGRGGIHEYYYCDLGHQTFKIK